MRLGISLSLTQPLGGFSPASLFALAEPGVWYDPSDLNTLFQDTAGTTPVTAAGQAVGLVIDKSKGGKVGAEAIPDPSFDLGIDGWTATGAISWDNVNKSMRVEGLAGSANGGARYTTSIPVLPAKGILINFTVSELPVGAQVVVLVTNGGATEAVNSGYIGSTGTYQFLGRTAAGGNGLAVVSIEIRRNFGAASAGDYAKISYFSTRPWEGNHATQSTAASRPTYGVVPATGRRNLLTYSEQFDNAAWGKGNATVTANAGIAPDGTMTADKLIESAGVTRGRTVQSLSTSVGNTISVYAKAAEWNRVCIGITNTSGLWGVAVFNLANGTVDGGASYGGDAVDTPVITFVGNGWYRCSVRVAAGTSSPVIMPFNQSGDPVNPSPALTGDGTSGILIWGAQLETGSSATNYQRVGSAFDVTEAGVPSLSYLSFDGVDDFLVTPTITPNIDKVQVFAGVRKLSDAAIGMLAEFGPTVNGTAGTWGHILPDTTSAGSLGLDLRGNGTSGIQRVSTGTAPATFVSAIAFDLSGTTFDTERPVKRINGAAATVLSSAGSTDTGGGNFTAQVLYIGRRGGTELPFNGQLYSLIVRFGANLDANTITNTETWVNSKTGAY